MTAPFDYMKHGLAAVKTLYGVELFLNQCGLEKSLKHLVKLLASQINGCAFCIDMHVDEAIADGENPGRLHLLSVWEETTIFSEREQAALAWTEAVTLIADGAPSQELFERMLQQFTEEELVNLNLAVVAINAWNRFGKTFHAQPALKSFKKAAATAAQA
ncbi:MAG: ahpD 2 [Akkermansiaceae bacterium]|nr:ahpD 2 [Akkermansiaceae bacterium]